MSPDLQANSPPFRSRGTREAIKSFQEHDTKANPGVPGYAMYARVCRGLAVHTRAYPYTRASPDGCARVVTYVNIVIRALVDQPPKVPAGRKLGVHGRESQVPWPKTLAVHACILTPSCSLGRLICIPNLT